MKIQDGTVTRADLSAAGAVQGGLAENDLADAGCPPTGNGCVDLYAVSIPGVTPSAYLTWFQAAAVARNSGKRLPSNAEWQAAALGTPDPGTDDEATDCSTSLAGAGAGDMAYGGMKRWRREKTMNWSNSEETTMADIKNVTGTAFIVAEWRAEENAAPDALYRDSVVELFLNDATRQAAVNALAANPSAKEAIKLRTRYLDDALEERIARGCRQVVILGSGLDTRAVRKQATGVAYFELDDNAILDLKRARFAKHGVQAALTLIPANYATDDWISLLWQNGFDFELPTHIIWEGNTMYLTCNDMKRVIVTIRERIRYATLSFDYFSTKVIDRTTGDPGLSALAEHFARLGAPWITGIDDVYALAGDLGLDVIDNVLSADLYRSYWPTRAMNASFLRFYSLCTLVTAR